MMNDNSPNSYWASNLLTILLRIMSRKFTTINLNQHNEPVEWKSDDEIGALVTAFNEMLTRLDESKAELTQNEKRSAWREMAKQVAHDIKNPLTHEIDNSAITAYHTS